MPLAILADRPEGLGFLRLAVRANQRHSGVLLLDLLDPLDVLRPILDQLGQLSVQLQLLQCVEITLEDPLHILFEVSVLQTDNLAVKYQCYMGG